MAEREQVPVLRRRGCVQHGDGTVGGARLEVARGEQVLGPVGGHLGAQALGQEDGVLVQVVLQRVLRPRPQRVFHRAWRQPWRKRHARRSGGHARRSGGQRQRCAGGQDGRGGHSGVEFRSFGALAHWARGCGGGGATWRQKRVVSQISLKLA
eukprot:scaffold50982_cov60-Phaeocystis_antarctica.AAC.2